jgi:RHS repeat-associated protein
MVATYRNSDTDPKERFVHQQAGDGGYGDSSYIDLVAFREKDANTAWTSASDGTLEERLYYCQNQHADVVAIVTSAGGQREMDRYSAYGVPFGLPEGDSNSDGLADATDRTIIQGWINTSAYDVRGDVDLDGDVDINDKNAVSALGAVTLGRGALSAGAVGNRRGVAAYEIDPRINYHVRERVLDSEVGVWLRRDPLGYVDGQNLFAALGLSPVSRTDPFGLCAQGGCLGSSPPPDPPPDPDRFDTDWDCEEKCTVTTGCRSDCYVCDIGTETGTKGEVKSLGATEGTIDTFLNGKKALSVIEAIADMGTIPVNLASAMAGILVEAAYHELHEKWKSGGYGGVYIRVCTEACVYEQCWAFWYESYCVQHKSEWTNVPGPFDGGNPNATNGWSGLDPFGGGDATTQLKRAIETARKKACKDM